MVIDLQPFSVSMLRISCQHWPEKKQELLSLVDWTDQSLRNDEQISDYHVNNVHGCPYVAKFCEIMTDELNLVLNEVSATNLSIEVLWGQRYAKTDYMYAHSHGALGLSAILYVEFDASEHTSTRFLSPFHNHAGTIDYYEPDVKEGDLLIFPSYLLHDAKPNKSPRKRTIFSFNFHVS